MFNAETWQSRSMERRAQLAHDIEFIRVEYGVDLVIAAALSPQEIVEIEAEGYNMSHKFRPKFSLAEKAHLARISARELSKYPRAYLEYSGFRKLRIFRGYENDEIHGLSDSAGSRLFASTKLGFDEIGWKIHHELSHNNDDIDSEGLEDFDYEWGVQFSQYLGIDHPVISLLASQPTPPEEGNEIEYEEDETEDRATLAEMIMQNSIWLRQEIGDQYIAAKTVWMLNAFSKRSGGLMDTDYFLDLFKGKVGEDYWIRREAAAA